MNQYPHKLEASPIIREARSIITKGGYVGRYETKIESFPIKYSISSSNKYSMPSSNKYFMLSPNKHPSTFSYTKILKISL